MLHADARMSRLVAYREVTRRGRRTTSATPRPSPKMARRRVCTSGLLGDLLAEDALRPQQQEEDQEQERETVLVDDRHVRRPERLHHSQGKAAEDRAANV